MSGERLDNIHNDPSLYDQGAAPTPTDPAAEQALRSNVEDVGAPVAPSDVPGGGQAQTGGGWPQKAIHDLDSSDLAELAEDNGIDPDEYDSDEALAEALRQAGATPAQPEPDDTWTRAELDAYAEAHGVNDAAGMANKGEVLEAIRAAS